MKNLIFCFDSRCILNSIEVALADYDCVILVVLLSFLPDIAKLVHSDESCRRLDARGELVSFGRALGSALGLRLGLLAEQGLINVASLACS